MATTQVIHHTIIKSSKPSLITSSSPNQFSKSSTKRLYESVFRIIDFEQPQLQYYDNENTNGSKFSSFITDQKVLSHLYQRMKMQGFIDHYPILKICCQQISNYSQNNMTLNYNNLYELDLNDIIQIYSKFGDLNKIIITLDSKFAYVFYNTFHTAYVALKMLNGLTFAGKMAKIHTEWVNNIDYQFLLPHLSNYLNSINWAITYKYNSMNNEMYNNQNQAISIQKQNKLTCRYEIQIQNQKQFQVARRIIGSKGCHMKKIIEESLQYAKGTQLYQNNPKHFQNINELLKLRLRGKGSGYKEGPQQQQSQQTLHLCVSAKDQICFQFACQKVQRLLQNVYDQYYDYTLQHGNPMKIYINKNLISASSGNISIIQNQNQINQMNMNQTCQYPSYDCQLTRITPNRICQLLQMRNKARRQLNFLQADRIRNFLRNCGVCLIDQKGRRGRATEVTTWKYLC